MTSALQAPAPSHRAPVSGPQLWAGLGALGAAAAVRPALPAVGPLCPLRRLTGIPCPACGASACAVALSRADLGAAVSANPVVLVVFLALLVAAVAPIVRTQLASGLRYAGNRPLWFVPITAVAWLYQLHRYDYL